MRQIEAGNFDSADFSAPGVDIQPEFLDITPRVETIQTPGIFRKSLIAASGIAATFAIACGGGDKDSGVSAVLVTNTPTSEVTTSATESPRATNTMVPTEAPKATVVPSPTEETIVPITDDVSIKSALVNVYKGVTVPQGSCTVDTISALVDELYFIYKANPNKASLTGGLSSVYAELIVLSKTQNNVQAEKTAKSIRAGVELLIEQHLQERGLPATNKPVSIAAWESNVGRKIEGIQDGSGCDIVLSSKLK